MPCIVASSISYAYRSQSIWRWATWAIVPLNGPHPNRKKAFSHRPQPCKTALRGRLHPRAAERKDADRQPTALQQCIRSFCATSGRVAL